jgi:hypothetical protein
MICVHDRTTQEQAEAWQPLLLIHPELSLLHAKNTGR